MRKSFLLITIAAAAILTTPPLASGQEGERRGPRSPEEQAKALKESLSLSDEQTEKVKAVFAKNREKIQALRDDKSLSDDDRRTKMRELFQGVENELKPILTPEQLAKWKEEREKRRAQRAGGQ